jgi:hypothetical protein
LEGAGFKVEPTNYGRFNLLKFLLPFWFFRRQAIEDVWKQIRVVVSNNPNAEISVIAHSFGTFVVSHMMTEGFELKFHRVIFCGSVVPYDFRFEQIQERFVPPIMNEIGTRDIWPAIAESITTGYGSAGTYGFRRPLVRDRWHIGARHGYFLKAAFCERYWIPFLRDGEIVRDSERAEAPPIWLQLISIVKIKYLFLALVLLALLIAVYRPDPSRLFPTQPASAPLDITDRLTSLDAGSTLRLSYPEQTVTIQPGVYSLDGRNFSLQAKQLELDGAITIRSFADGVSAPGGQAGGVGKPGGQGGGDGQNGAIGLQGGLGSAGEGGKEGRSSGSFLLEVGEIAKKDSGSFTIVAVGEPGGSGGPGGQGGPGGPGGTGRNRGGNAFCGNAVSPGNGGSGGKGGTGGLGAQGGRGGAGGQIEYAAALAKSLSANEIVLLAPGGRGGMGGKPGSGGSPGPGGAAGAGSHCGGGGDPGPQGLVGDAGAEGKRGADGTPGKISAR